MPSRRQEVLKHRYLYLPHSTVKDTLTLGKQLGPAVARERGLRLTVICPQKSNLTQWPELAMQDVVTARSGCVRDGGLVLAWCPTHKVMEKVQHLEKSVVMLVEWSPREFEAWARLRGAYNVVTGTTMDAALSTEALYAMEGILHEGHNNWTNRTDELLTRSHLDRLVKSGTYDRELVLTYARQTKSEESIKRLAKLLDSFETSHSSRRG